MDFDSVAAFYVSLCRVLEPNSSSSMEASEKQALYVQLGFAYASVADSQAITRSCS